jgi:hypothetical protein
MVTELTRRGNKVMAHLDVLVGNSIGMTGEDSKFSQYSR